MCFMKEAIRSKTWNICKGELLLFISDGNYFPLLEDISKNRYWFIGLGVQNSLKVPSSNLTIIFLGGVYWKLFSISPCGMDCVHLLSPHLCEYILEMMLLLLLLLEDIFVILIFFWYLHNSIQTLKSEFRKENIFQESYGKRSSVNS